MTAEMSSPRAEALKQKASEIKSGPELRKEAKDARKASRAEKRGKSKGFLKNKWNGVTEASSQAFNSVKDKAAAKVDSVKQSARDKVDRAAGWVDDKAQAASDKLGAAADWASEKGQAAKEWTGEKATEVGYLVVDNIPLVDTIDRLQAEARAKMKDMWADAVEGYTNATDYVEQQIEHIDKAWDSLRGQVKAESAALAVDAVKGSISLAKNILGKAKEGIQKLSELKDTAAESIDNLVSDLEGGVDNLRNQAEQRGQNAKHLSGLRGWLHRRGR